MIPLDLNHPESQHNLLALEKIQAWAVLQTLPLLRSLSWSQLHSSKGLRWELIQSRRGPQGKRLHSLRISRSCRAVASGPIRSPLGALVGVFRSHSELRASTSLG